MFTIEQIKAAHSKVKTGADFPSYIRELKELGVTRYETYVSDGHVDYYGSNGYTQHAPGKYEPLTIADESDSVGFRTELKAHQQGMTDYPTFIHMCGETGIQKWEVDMEKMTCTYFDKNGKEVLEERIPA